MRASGTSLSSARTGACKVCSRGGIFDWARHDPWNQRRSHLSHTRYGNGVLAIWADSSRWDSVVGAAYRDSHRWSPASREVWRNSFRQWGIISQELLEHARRIHEEFRKPIRRGTTHAWTSYCINVRRLFDASVGRYDEWVADVETRVSRVEAAVRQLGALGAHGEAPQEALSFSEDEARKRLLALSESGKALKQIYSGRGYFNYGESD